VCEKIERTTLHTRQSFKMEATPEQIKEVIEELELENSYLKEENLKLKLILRNLAQQPAAAAIEVTDFLDVADDDLN